MTILRRVKEGSPRESRRVSKAMEESEVRTGSVEGKLFLSDAPRQMSFEIFNKRRFDSERTQYDRRGRCE